MMDNTSGTPEWELDYHLYSKVVQKIKEKNKDLPFVILMTGYSEVTNEEAMIMGASELLLKPLDIRGLVGRITNTYAQGIN